MLTTKGEVVLIDFGTSLTVKANGCDLVKETAGTPAFHAPEMVVRPKDGAAKEIHGKRIDVWALGVTLYQMGSLELPFKSNKMMELRS